MIKHETRVKHIAEFVELLMRAGDPFEKAFEDAKMLERRILKDSIHKMLNIRYEDIQLIDDFTPMEIHEYMNKES